jgi:phosphoserine phosphatase
VVVATAAEVTLARGFLAALGLGDLDVVASTGWPHPRRVHGETKVRALVDRGCPPPWTAVYTDSAADLPLLAGTPHPVLVDPGRRLRASGGAGARPRGRRAPVEVSGVEVSGAEVEVSGAEVLSPANLSR